MSVASPNFVEGGESFKSKNSNTNGPGSGQHNEESLRVTAVFLGFRTFPKSDT